MQPHEQTNNKAELFLAVYKLRIWYTLDGIETSGTLEMVAESNLEAIETARGFLVSLGAERFSFNCKQLYSLLWSFVTVE